MSEQRYYVSRDASPNFFFNSMEVALLVGYGPERLYEITADIDGGLFLYQVQNISAGMVMHTPDARTVAKFIDGASEDSVFVIDTFHLVSGNA